MYFSSIIKQLLACNENKNSAQFIKESGDTNQNILGLK